MTSIISLQSETGFELSRGQFAEFFQISNVSNATRVLRRMYSKGETEYKGFQVRVEKRDNQYVAILSPSPEKTIISPVSVISESVSINSAPVNDSFNPPFCDWLTIHQNYDYQLPQLNSGCVVSLNSIPQNEEGHYEFQGSDIEFLTTRFVSHKGSYESSLQLRVDGSKLTLSGNVGRFGRPDNLFGYSISDCVCKANRILDSLNLDLPHFTVGEYISPHDEIIPCKKPRKVLDPLRPTTGKELFISQNAHVVGYEEMMSSDWKTYQVPKYGYVKTKSHWWTGAWISQLHLTKNLQFQNQDEANLFMDWACRQNPFGMSVHPHYGQGVNYGKNSAFVSPKLYLKGLEILENKKYRHIDENYRDKLLKYIGNKIVRFEINYKKFLAKNGVKYLGDVMNEQKSNVLYVDFKNRFDKIFSNNIDFYEGLEGLTRRQKEQFMSWTRGISLKDAYWSKSKGRPSSTYDRLHKLFQEQLGVDISIPYSEQHSILRVRHLECQGITQIPEFYQCGEFDEGFKLVA